MFDGDELETKRSGMSPESMLSTIRALREMGLDAPAGAAQSVEELRTALTIAEISLLRMIAERDGYSGAARRRGLPRRRGGAKRRADGSATTS